METNETLLDEAKRIREKYLGATVETSNFAALAYGFIDRLIRTWELKERTDAMNEAIERKLRDN